MANAVPHDRFQIYRCGKRNMRFLTSMSERTTLSGLIFVLLMPLFSPGLLRAQDRIPPSTPTDLIATPANCRQVDLSWTASVDEPGGSGLKAYIIQRSDGVESTIVALRTTFSDAKRISPSTAL